MTDYTLSQVDSIADFAKRIGVTPQTAAQWMDKAGDSAPKAVRTIARTRLYLTTDLERMAADNASGAAMRAMGYVHPQKYAELESRNRELINEKSVLALINQDLNAQLDESQRVIASMKEDVEFLARLRAAGVDNWEGFYLAHPDNEDELNELVG